MVWQLAGWIFLATLCIPAAGPRPVRRTLRFSSALAVVLLFLLLTGCSESVAPVSPSPQAPGIVVTPTPALGPGPEATPALEPAPDATPTPALPANNSYPYRYRGSKFPAFNPADFDGLTPIVISPDRSTNLQALLETQKAVYVLGPSDSPVPCELGMIPRSGRMEGMLFRATVHQSGKFIGEVTQPYFQSVKIPSPADTRIMVQGWPAGAPFDHLLLHCSGSDPGEFLMHE